MVYANRNKSEQTFVKLVEQALKNQQDGDAGSLGEIHSPPLR